jgi:hypothetical protein
MRHFRLWTEIVEKAVEAQTAHESTEADVESTATTCNKNPCGRLLILAGGNMLDRDRADEATSDELF